jgi:hypothetical protein
MRFIPVLGLLLSAFAFADSTPSVVFLDGNAARAAIVNDAREPYFEKLQAIEIAAKVGEVLPGTLAEQRLAARQRYQQAVRPFRPEEQQAIRAYIDALQPFLRGYPRFARQPWKFVKVADHIEGGLPHTRDNFIVLTEAVSKQLFDMRRQLTPENALLRGGMLLLHEQVHVLQRLEPSRFEKLYTITFGYQRVAMIPLPDDLRLNQVANPDGMSCCWLFPRGTGMLWPFLVFTERDGVRRMPADFRMRAVAVEGAGGSYRVLSDSDGRSQTEDLLKVREYVEAFPLTQNFYHPNEAAADLFAQLILFDGIASLRMPPTQREALEKEFARQRPAFKSVFAR